MKINTTINIEIGGRKLILSSEEAHELYRILRKELGMDNRFKEVFERTHNDRDEGYLQCPQPANPDWPWKMPPIITCGSIE
jgi:hypothetical protein